MEGGGGGVEGQAKARDLNNFWVKCPTPGPYGCIHLNKNGEEKNRHHVTFSSAVILHMSIKNTHISQPPSLVTNLPGNATVNQLVTRSLSASSPNR